MSEPEKLGDVLRRSMFGGEVAMPDGVDENTRIEVPVRWFGSVGTSGYGMRGAERLAEFWRLWGEMREANTHGWRFPSLDRGWAGTDMVGGRWSEFDGE